MTLITHRSAILFLVGWFSVLTARVVFRLFVGRAPLIDLAMMTSAIIAAGLTAVALEYVLQRRGR